MDCRSPFFVIKIGIGLSLTIADSTAHARRPRASIVGLIGQLTLPPLLALGIAWVFGLTPMMALGVVLVAAAPGGATSNLATYLARGSVALSIILTVAALQRQWHGFFRPKMDATINGAPCSIEFSNSPLTARLALGAQPAATLQRQWDGIFQEFWRPHRYTLSFECHTDERTRAAILGIAVAIDMVVLAAQQG
ncbi:hypothetical protein [Corynebacterium sanguinis]